MHAAYVYIMSNTRHGTLYVGVTTNLPRRVGEHQQGTYQGFTKKYRLTKLVYYEGHEWIEGAIQRESQLKNWPRQTKIKLIEKLNPEWTDLSEGLNG